VAAPAETPGQARPRGAVPCAPDGRSGVQPPRQARLTLQGYHIVPAATRRRVQCSAPRRVSKVVSGANAGRVVSPSETGLRGKENPKGRQGRYLCSRLRGRQGALPPGGGPKRGACEQGRRGIERIQGRVTWRHWPGARHCSASISLLASPSPPPSHTRGVAQHAVEAPQGTNDMDVGNVGRPSLRGFLAPASHNADGEEPRPALPLTSREKAVAHKSVVAPA